MDIKIELAALLQEALNSVAPQAADTPIVLERPRDTSHGDFSSNLAMRLARVLKKKPQDIAHQLVAELPLSPKVEAAEVAGAGFINFRLSHNTKHSVVANVLAAGSRFGSATDGAGQKVMVEFVSANPTGPLHVGHGRGAAFGASLSALLAFAGWDVTREYYVNDAGRQMDILAVSTWLRYLQQHGETHPQLPFPPNGYQGDYVREMAEQLTHNHQTRFVRSAATVADGLPPWPQAGCSDDEAKKARELCLDAYIAKAKVLLGSDWTVVHQHALTAQLADCRQDLQEFGVEFDVWFSERSLFDTGLVARAVNLLDERGHLYTQNGAKWFRSTAFGDEKDRVVQRDNGSYTYFASDIAYHLNKYERGFARLLNVWGADHHGYVPRVKGALTALGQNADQLDVALVQFAVLYRNGQKMSMSTRSGEFVTLRALRHEVGNDACRFFYALRKSDQHLDFDLDLATRQSNDNPVYYIQYAHARIASLLRQWQDEEARLGAEPITDWGQANINVALLDGEKDLALCEQLQRFPDVVRTAARELAPHQIAFYLKNLAGEFHGWYNATRVLVDDAALSQARLALALAVKQVIVNGMTILGVTCPDSM